MNPDQIIRLITNLVAILGPTVGVTIWLCKREETNKTKAVEKSLGAQAVFSLMEQLNKIRTDIEHLKASDKGRTEEILVLEKDYKELNHLIIDLLRTKK